METVIARGRIIKEIQQIPEEKLSEVFNFLHYFRLGVQKTKRSSKGVMKYAGCWQDMPENQFSKFVDDINQRRKDAFSLRRNSEPSVD